MLGELVMFLGVLIFVMVFEVFDAFFEVLELRALALILDCFLDSLVELGRRHCLSHRNPQESAKAGPKGECARAGPAIARLPPLAMVRALQHARY